MQKKFWQSSNFWTTLLVGVIGGFFVIYPGDAIGEGVKALFTVIYSGAIVSDWARSDGAKFDWKHALKDANWWNYLGSLVIVWWDKLPAEFFQELGNVVSQALAGNYQGALIGVFGLLSILFHIFIKPMLSKEVAAIAGPGSVGRSMPIFIVGAALSVMLVGSSSKSDIFRPITWEVHAVWEITYTLYSPSGMPSGYYVKVMHVEFPRRIVQKTYPTLEDVTWAPDLSKFDNVPEVKAVQLNVTQLSGKRLEPPAQLPQATE
jgi:hypothetical protein